MLSNSSASKAIWGLEIEPYIGQYVWLSPILLKPHLHGIQVMLKAEVELSGMNYSLSISWYLNSYTGHTNVLAIILVVVWAQDSARRYGTANSYLLRESCDGYYSSRALTSPMDCVVGVDVTIGMYVRFIRPPDVVDEVIIVVVLPRKPVCKLNSKQKSLASSPCLLVMK